RLSGGREGRGVDALRELLFAEMEVLHEIDGRQDRGTYADLGDVFFDLVLAVEVRNTRRRDLEVHVEGRLVVNSVSLARRVAVEGLALVQAPPLFIASELSEGKLATVLEQWAPTPTTGFFLYYPSRRQMRPALKALVDFLRDEHH